MKRALLVGIDYYEKLDSLRGCVTDASVIGRLLTFHDDADKTRNFEVRTLLASGVASALRGDDVMSELERLFRPGADVVFLYFAGHARAAYGETGDVLLQASDGDKRTGVNFSHIERLIRACPGEVIVLLDCCYSGAAGSVELFNPGGAARERGVTVIAASRGDEPTIAQPQFTSTSGGDCVVERGVFSFMVEAGLEGGAADVLGDVTVAGLFAYLNEAFGSWAGSRPTMRASVTRLEPIRRCKPSVPLATLRQLPRWFPEDATVFPLDPSYEPSLDPRNDDHEEVLACLRQCLTARLIEPVDCDYLYQACQQSTGCRLTPLGRRYRRVAAEGRL